jgi:hypothetical protein
MIPSTDGSTGLSRTESEPGIQDSEHSSSKETPKPDSHSAIGKISSSGGDTSSSSEKSQANRTHERYAASLPPRKSTETKRDTEKVGAVSWGVIV